MKLYAIKTKDELERLDKLASLENQVKELSCKTNQENRIFFFISKKVFKPVTTATKEAAKETTEWLGIQRKQLSPKEKNPPVPLWV